MMNRMRVLRGFVGLMTAVVLSGGGSAGAVGGSSAGGGSTGDGAALPVRASAAIACVAGTRACPIRITFASGAYTGQAHAQLTGITSQKWFVVHARADQRMIVIVEGRGPTRGTVYFPNGRSSGQPGGRVFDANILVTGDYRIRVTESSMGETWSGGVDVVMVIY